MGKTQSLYPNIPGINLPDYTPYGSPTTNQELLDVANELSKGLKEGQKIKLPYQIMTESPDKENAYIQQLNTLMQGINAKNEVSANEYNETGRFKSYYGNDSIDDPELRSTFTPFSGGTSDVRSPILPSSFDMIPYENPTYKTGDIEVSKKEKAPKFVQDKVLEDPLDIGNEDGTLFAINKAGDGDRNTFVGDVNKIASKLGNINANYIKTGNLEANFDYKGKKGVDGLLAIAAETPNFDWSNKTNGVITKGADGNLAVNLKKMYKVDKNNKSQVNVLVQYADATGNPHTVPLTFFVDGVYGFDPLRVDSQNAQIDAQLNAKSRSDGIAYSKISSSPVLNETNFSKIIPAFKESLVKKYGTAEGVKGAFKNYLNLEQYDKRWNTTLPDFIVKLMARNMLFKMITK
jgi:hypothetical protein